MGLLDNINWTIRSTPPCMLYQAGSEPASFALLPPPVRLVANTGSLAQWLQGTMPHPSQLPCQCYPATSLNSTNLTKGEVVKLYLSCYNPSFCPGMFSNNNLCLLRDARVPDTLGLLCDCPGLLWCGVMTITWAEL